MTGSEILLTNLIEESNIVTEKPVLINEQPFKFFARATSVLEEDKCLFVGDVKYLRQVDKYTKMIITNQETYEAAKDLSCGFCITERPRDLFFQLMNEHEMKNGIDQTTTSYGSGCQISSLTSVSSIGVKIGSNVVIEDFVQIGPNVTIGDNTIIRAGAKIGVQGFNIYEFHGKSSQLFHDGRVVIGENVLIGPNTIVQQALYNYGNTVIGANSKIDGNVVIGHNAIIGENVEITAGSCVAGYVEIGDNSIIRLNVTIRNGIKVGKNAQVGMGSVVVYRVRDNGNVFGNPAKDLVK